jgi:hypothetical protein
MSRRTWIFNELIRWRPECPTFGYPTQPRDVLFTSLCSVRMRTRAVCWTEIRLYSVVWHLLPTHCRCRAFCCTWSVNDIYAHTHTHSRTPLDEGSACRRKLYLTKHSVQNRQTAMHTAGFESAIPATARLPASAAVHFSTSSNSAVLCSVNCIVE